MNKLLLVMEDVAEAKLNGGNEAKNDEPVDVVPFGEGGEGDNGVKPRTLSDGDATVGVAFATDNIIAAELLVFSHLALKTGVSIIVVAAKPCFILTESDAEREVRAEGAIKDDVE